MTRINAGIQVSKLTDQHLLAEHREITRVPNSIRGKKIDVNEIPKEFCLGAGHVKFFWDKLAFLHFRYIELFEECKKRGFNVEDKRNAFLPSGELYNHYTPTIDCVRLLKERIQQRLIDSKQTPRYYKKPLEKHEAKAVFD